GPQRAKSVLERIQEQMVETGLSRLKKASPDILHSVLRGEHPQTIALVLAHLDPRLSAGVIEAMAPEMCADTLFRMARMEKVAPDVLQMVEAALGSRSDLTLTQELTASGGPAAVAKVLTNLPSSLEKSMLEAISARGSEVAEQIRNFMFVFEDLTQIEARAMQRLLADVEVKTLALALKAASDELKQHIMANMSERAASTLREEIEVLSRVRVKDVEAAHAAILATARGLQEQGEIVLEIGTGDDIIA
ncbi:MAG: FliG C-terminal domain-containing protein, partial [Gemmatimonadota bacterium]